MGFLDKKPNRGDLLGLRTGPTAGESFRVKRGTSNGAASGVGPRAKVRLAGEGETAESIRGDWCLEEPFGDKPNRDLRGDVAV